MKIHHYQNYIEYLSKQSKSSRNKKGYVKIEKHMMELSFITGHFAQRYYKKQDTVKILCVGARNISEAIAWHLAFPLVKLDITLIDIIGSKSKIIPKLRALFGKDTVIHGDMNALQFSDDSFDVVYSCSSFEHTCKPATAATEMSRVVKHGGLIYLIVPSEEDTTPAHTDCTYYASSEEVIELFGMKPIITMEQKDDGYWRPEYRILLEK